MYQPTLSPTKIFFHSAAAALLAGLALSCSAEGLAERVQAEHALADEPVAEPLIWPESFDAWSQAWMFTDLANLKAAPKFQVGSVQVAPSLFTNRGSLSGAGLWVGKGETWHLALGSRRQQARPGLGFAPGLGEKSLVTASYLWSDQHSLSFQWMRQGDKELGQQRAMHLVYGAGMPGSQTLKLGVSAISGWEPVTGSQQRMGMSLGYDWPRQFVKLSYDPQSYFNVRDEVRFSWGTRF